MPVPRALLLHLPRHVASTLTCKVVESSRPLVNIQDSVEGKRLLTGDKRKREAKLTPPAILFSYRVQRP